MKKHLILMLALFGAVLGFQAHAQSVASPSLATDDSLVGIWSGEFAATTDETCSAYMWRMTRKSDGTYTYNAFDATQTILNDTGKWWVDKRSGQYFETVAGQSDEPTTYTYAVMQSNFNDSGTQAEFTATKPAIKGECAQAQHYTASKMNP